MLRLLGNKKTVRAPEKKYFPQPPSSMVRIRDICNHEVQPVTFIFREVQMHKLDSRQAGDPLNDFLGRLRAPINDFPHVTIILERHSGGALQVRVSNGVQRVTVVRNKNIIHYQMLHAGFFIGKGDLLKLFFNRVIAERKHSGPLCLEYCMVENEFVASPGFSLMGGKMDPNEDEEHPAWARLTRMPTKECTPEVNEGKTSLLDLPESVLGEILSNLPPEDVLYGVTLTCQELFKAVWSGGVPFRRISLPWPEDYTTEELNAIVHIGGKRAPNAISIDKIYLDDQGDPSTYSAKFLIQSLTKRAANLELHFRRISSHEITSVELEQAREIVYQKLRELEPSQSFHESRLQRRGERCAHVFSHILLEEIIPRLSSQHHQQQMRHAHQLFWATLEPKIQMFRILPHQSYQRLRVLTIEVDLCFPIQDHVAFPNLEEIWLRCRRVNLHMFFGDEGATKFPSLTTIGYTGAAYCHPAIVHIPSVPVATRLERVCAGPSIEEFPFHLISASLRILDLRKINASTLGNLGEQLSRLQNLQIVSLDLRQVTNNDTCIQFISCLPPCVKTLKVHMVSSSLQLFRQISEACPDLKLLWASFTTGHAATLEEVAALNSCHRLEGFHVQEGEEIQEDIIGQQWKRNADFWQRVNCRFGRPAVESNEVGKVVKCACRHRRRCTC